MFFYEVEGHMPQLSSFGQGKTIRPKKSLMSFLHAALQILFVTILIISSSSVIVLVSVVLKRTVGDSD